MIWFIRQYFLIADTKKCLKKHDFYDRIEIERGEKMKEQRYVIEKIDTFDVTDIFNCGQCFRWKEQLDKSYTGVFGKNVLNVRQTDKEVIFQGICEEDIQSVCRFYFDLDRDYEKMQRKLMKVDTYMQTSIGYGKGIRILNQDLWETILSFIISANNNIPRIKGIIDRLCKTYGDKIIYQEKIYDTFPTPEQLKNVTIEDFRKLGLGFRDKRVYETTHAILEKQVDLEELICQTDANKVRETLLTLSGVGPKVADCILLFSTLKRLDVFPVDVWVRRVMNELYIKNRDENKVSTKQIEKIAHEKFGNMAGLAQQYLFYWKKEA